MTIRQEVMASIIEWMEGVPKGTDPYSAALKHFPDVPDLVLAEASVALDMERTEAWWRSIEKTIDGEVIKAALIIGVEPRNEGEPR